jgi:hypothetical protein
LIDRLNGLEEIKNSYFPQCFCAVDTTISSSENFKQQKLFFSCKNKINKKLNKINKKKN